MSEMAGRYVVVVGAGGALGSAIAAAFTTIGADVRGMDRAIPQNRLDGVEYTAVDVLDDGALGVAFDSERVPWAVVNVVGVEVNQWCVTGEPADELSTQLRLNLTTAALITKHALRRMGETGEGRLVHTASRAALITEGSGFAYSVSKLAVLHLVQLAAQETHGTGVTVNAVVPSIMDTPANRAAIPSANHDQWPKLDDVAAVYVWLASPAAGLVSGAAIPVYGRS